MESGPALLPSLAPIFSDDAILAMCEAAIGWSSTNGLLMGVANTGHSSYVPMWSHAPFTLLPTPIPTHAFQKVVSVCDAMTDLVYRVSQDADYLLSSLRGVEMSDDFTANLMTVQRDVLEYRSKYFKSCDSNDPSHRCPYETISLGILRSDYLLDRNSSLKHSEETCYHGYDGYGIKQVEINTIAASFACLSQKTGGLHRFITDRYGYLRNVHSSSAFGLPLPNPQQLPLNKSGIEVANGINQAVRLYQLRREEQFRLLISESASMIASNLVVVMIVQDGERNSVDQRVLEDYLWTNHRIPLIRRSLGYIYQHATLLQSSVVKESIALGLVNELMLDDYVVSVAYFRAGYTPNDYKTTLLSPTVSISNIPSSLVTCAEWVARVMIERSWAICCPSIGYQLAGTKKLQQELSQQGAVEKFVLSPDAVLAIRQVFVGLYTLDHSEDPVSVDEIISKALARCDRYVLKPQREGGGNNVYGEAIVHHLKSLTKQQLAAFILMDKIVSPSSEAIVIRDGKWHRQQLISEIGIYSVHLGGRRCSSCSNSSTPVVYLNQFAGTLLRSKPIEQNETGVAAGFGVMDSVMLLDS